MSVQSELKKIKSILKNGDKIFTKVVPNCFCKGVNAHKTQVHILHSSTINADEDELIENIELMAFRLNQKLSS